MEAPEKNISHVVFGSYEIKAWYYSPYVLDGLVRPDTSGDKPLRLNGGFSEDTPHEEGDGDLTDSTDVDDSMQRLPEASTSSRPVSPSVPLRAHAVRRETAPTVPSASRPAALRKEAKIKQGSGRHRSPAAKPSEEPAGAPASLKSRKDKSVQAPVKLYVCEGCFKYMVHPASYAIHFRSCKIRHPPGRKVYQKGAQTIWEVDGEAEKLYCQNLCLFGKLFIDHKYVFFETSGFLFYVLTEGRPSFDHVFGFFSKEKISYNDYNLACIVTFPPYQRKGYGTVMIEFSYELSSRSLYSRRAGTPERPLSDLGLRGYLQYWTSVLVRYFRLIFYTRNDPRLHVSTQTVVLPKPKHRKKLRGFQGEIIPETTELLAVPSTVMSKLESPSASPEPIPTDADHPVASAVVAQPTNTEEDPGTSLDTATQSLKVEGASMATAEFEMQFSLAEIANATDLREDDVAFTLVHSGLANFRCPIPAHPATSGEGDVGETAVSDIAATEMQIVITSAIVEEVASKFKVKQQPALSKAHCLF